LAGRESRFSLTIKKEERSLLAKTGEKKNPPAKKGGVSQLAGGLSFQDRGKRGSGKGRMYVKVLEASSAPFCLVLKLKEETRIALAV